MKIGIERLGFYTPRYYLDLATLARERNSDFLKYKEGIGQEKMAVPAPDEDIVTMGANAADCALEGLDRQDIHTVMFATESGIDQSKAGGIYIHRLLGLPAHARVVELKQACYSGTAALQMAAALLTRSPRGKILIITSDIARYGLGSAGEVTQGAGAVAMVVSTTPHILTLDPEAGAYTEDVMDFWRPNYRDEALVDGKYSIRVYLKALGESWSQYRDLSDRSFNDFSRFCFHLPFTRMAEKAIKHLAKISGHKHTDETSLLNTIASGLNYNRMVGNVYTASLYLSLMSLLDQDPADVSGTRIGLFSYGSGCVGELFSGVVEPSYKTVSNREYNETLLSDRQELSYSEYTEFYTFAYPQDGSELLLPRHETGKFRLASFDHHKRHYEQVS
jgi:hydroxymethylglutaryl-CoA synthase